MMKFFNFLSRISMASLGNILLGFIASAMAICAIILTAFYLIQYVDRESPEFIEIKCFIGIADPQCKDYQKELDDLAAQRKALAEQLAALKQKLKNLALIEQNVDSVTLFSKTPLPNKNLSVTIGTRYSRLLEPELNPSYFCYIELKETGGLSRNLYIRDGIKNISPKEDVLRKADLSSSDLKFARSVCKPYLIIGA